MRRLSSERGNVAIIVALMMTTLMGIGALVIDYGTLVTRDTGLQTGADAAALAIARNCAEHAVSPTATGCNDTMAGSLAASYFNANAGSGVTVERDLDVSYGGRAGRITVSGSATEEPAFARMLGITEPQPVSATATARWGPLTAVDAVFPLVVCKGALPEPDIGPVTLMVDPASTTDPDACDGAPDEAPFGWITPDDPDLCTAKVTLLPSTYFDVAPSDQEPATAGCQLQIDELHNDIDSTAVCHTTPNEPYHCHGSSTAEDRTRVLAVYDPQAGSPTSRPSYSLLAFEFSGARLGDRASHSAGGWSGPCDPTDPTYAIDELQCIEGVVRDYIPPTDGPIVDPTLAALPSIDDTTVLDVRLVE